MAKVTAIGSGSWGTALACVAARANHQTIIWGRTSSIVDEINSDHKNRKYLQELTLEPTITASTDLAEAINEADIILLSVPAQTLSQVLEQLSSVPAQTIFVTTCKGIDRETGQLPTQLVKSAFPDNPVAALSGPSFAADVVKNLPTAVTVASRQADAADKVAKFLSTPAFRCYSTDDVLGVELGGALKNVLALAVGAARGMELGASAEAALIARGFSEIVRLAVYLGARAETLTGLSGLGDIALTCSTPQSRNFTYGMAMGRNENLSGLKLAEGAYTAGVALRLAREAGIDVPITEAVVNVLENRVTAREAVSQLLNRPLKREN